MDETVAALGRLDVLVNNAGVTVSKPALELTADDFDAIFSVDVKGAFLLSVAAAKEMRRHGDGGAIVNVTSVHEHVPRPGFALYAPAKAALGMITRSLALELGADGIRVNAVAPGLIDTDMIADRIRASPSRLREGAGGGSRRQPEYAATRANEHAKALDWSDGATRMPLPLPPPASGRGNGYRSAPRSWGGKR